MDEASFQIDSTQLAEVSRRFPAHRLTPAQPHPDADLSYLRTDGSAEFARHAWDEGGPL